MKLIVDQEIGFANITVEPNKDETPASSKPMKDLQMNFKTYLVEIWLPSKRPEVRCKDW